MQDWKLTDKSVAGKNVEHVVLTFTRKLCYRKDDRAMRPIYGCPDNFL